MENEEEIGRNGKKQEELGRHRGKNRKKQLEMRRTRKNRKKIG